MAPALGTGEPATLAALAASLDAAAAESAKQGGESAGEGPGARYHRGYADAMADAARLLRTQPERRPVLVSADALRSVVALVGEFLPGWSERERYKRAADFLHAGGVEVEGWSPDGANRLAVFEASRRANDDVGA